MPFLRQLQSPRWAKIPIHNESIGAQAEVRRKQSLLPNANGKLCILWLRYLHFHLLRKDLAPFD